MPENNRLTLRGGRVIDPAGGVDAVLDVHVDGGRIIGLGAAPDGSAGEVIDVRGAWVVPGLVDLAGQFRPVRQAPVLALAPDRFEQVHLVGQLPGFLHQARQDAEAVAVAGEAPLEGFTVFVDFPDH